MDRTSITDLLNAIGGEAHGLGAGSFDAVDIDSRTVRPGAVFWALPGERHDGHDFIADALDRGAVAAVVDSRLPTPHSPLSILDSRLPTPAPLIAVDDTTSALAKFAGWYRRRQNALVIGVTGSVGKTTCREMLHAVLSIERAGIRSPRNFNNHLGLPLSVFQIDRRHEFAVLELGSSAPGEIAGLAETAAPEIGIVTAIGAAHLDGFGSIEGVLQAKGELIEALPPSGFAVLPGDDPLTRRLADRAACRVLFVGETEDNDVRATHITAETDRLAFRVDGAEYVVPVAGRHHLTAALCAIAIGRELGMPTASIAAGLRSFEPVAGRGRVERIGPWTVIDDSYNANPCSMRAACELLRTIDAPRRVLVVGDMLELGEAAETLHRDLGRMSAVGGIDWIVAFGTHAEEVVAGARDAGAEADRLAACEDFDDLLAVLDDRLEAGDALLVKGSRGMRMERVIAWLRERGTTHDELPTTSRRLGNNDGKQREALSRFCRVR